METTLKIGKFRGILKFINIHSKGVLNLLYAPITQHQPPVSSSIICWLNPNPAHLKVIFEQPLTLLKVSPLKWCRNLSMLVLTIFVSKNLANNHCHIISILENYNRLLLISVKEAFTNQMTASKGEFMIEIRIYSFLWNFHLMWWNKMTSIATKVQFETI